VRLPSSTFIRPTIAVALFFAATVTPIRGQLTAITNEDRLKAAFVYRFPQFVERPAESLDGQQTLDICVGPPNPFGDTLQQLVAGESLDGRRLNVRHLSPREEPSECHVLYLPGDRYADGLRLVADQPILTVGDSQRFLDEGGIIRLSVMDRRVRFEVNAVAAERARLRLSSQLLRLALAVRGVRE